MGPSQILMVLCIGCKSNAYRWISGIGWCYIIKATTGPMNINYEEDSQQLEEVVVTGYGGKQLGPK